MKNLMLGLVALMLFVAACGSDSQGAAVSGEAPATTAAPATTEAPEPTDAPVSTEEMEDETELSGIISMSATATEMLFAIGAGDQVIAVDDQSNYPDEAPMSDLSSFTPSVEAIAAWAPETVVISFDPGDLTTGLEALGITVLNHPPASTLDDTYAQLAELGELTGEIDGAAQVVADMRSLLDDMTIPEGEALGATYYHELDPTYFSATSMTFIGEVYNRLGMVNIADEADPDGFGFPQLTEEYILEADPDFIFLADTKCCGESADTVAARPGWDALSAVQNGTVIELDDDIASRWGPRVTTFMTVVAEAMANSLIDA